MVIAGFLNHEQYHVNVTLGAMNFPWWSLPSSSGHRSCPWLEDSNYIVSKSVYNPFTQFTTYLYRIHWHSPNFLRYQPCMVESPPGWSGLQGHPSPTGPPEWPPLKRHVQPSRRLQIQHNAIVDVATPSGQGRFREGGTHKNPWDDGIFTFTYHNKTTYISSYIWITNRNINKM